MTLRHFLQKCRDSEEEELKVQTMIRFQKMAGKSVGKQNWRIDLVYKWD